MLNRRSFILTGLAAGIMAPAIVPVKSLMHLPRRPWFIPRIGQLYAELQHLDGTIERVATERSGPVTITLPQRIISSTLARVSLARDGNELWHQDGLLLYLPTAATLQIDFREDETGILHPEFDQLPSEENT